MAYTDKLRVVYGDYTLGVHGEGFDYIFSYAQGGLESIVKNGYEWLYRCPKPAFWRALTAISKMELLKSICLLISRGALISMIVILVVLPAALMLCDWINALFLFVNNIFSIFYAKNVSFLAQS